MNFLIKVKNILRYIYVFMIEHQPWRLRYYKAFVKLNHRRPNLKHPQDYRDYIFRDNFHQNHDKHAYLADKYRVREYVEKVGLGHTLTKLYGAWENANDIDFDALPSGFAIKCNHSCGMNIICQDKSKLDIEATRKQLNEWVNEVHPEYFERHYRNIKPMIICEELIPNDKDGFFPMDYKIHCANGKPVYIQCCFERSTEDVGRRVIYSTDWENLHYIKEDYHYTDKEVERPKHLKEMLEYATILSTGLEYARIDFYDTDERVIFGEVTLTPMGGWLEYFTQEAVDRMGEEIKLNKDNHPLF